METIIEKVRKTQKLYHYTTFDNALKIIIGRQLRFGELPYMNDFIESTKIIGCSSFDSNTNDELQKRIMSYRQISLTLDKDILGFDLPAMWGIMPKRTMVSA